jgi:hypothetical protein
MQLKMEEDGFVERLSDEATFHIGGKVNRRNDRIWGTEQPYAQIEHQGDSLTFSVRCPTRKCPFVFTEATVTSDSYPDTLENWLLLQLNTSYDDYILQLETALPPIFT